MIFFPYTDPVALFVSFRFLSFFVCVIEESVV